MSIIEKMKSNQNIQIQQLTRARHICVTRLVSQVEQELLIRPEHFYFLSVLQFKVSDYTHLVSSSYSLNEGILIFRMLFIEITTNQCNQHIDEASYQVNI
jgi:hypothetical protein